MRKAQQKKIIEMLQTLDEANTEIRQLFSRGELPSAIQVLTECQEFAVAIGTYIKSVEGEGTQTVGLLEEYCDELYGVSVEASGGSSTKSFAKRLRKKLIKIENSVRAELKPNKIEIAFFPYKAAMWDSLESIWNAAVNDPQCVAYMIPVPYYERVPGGGFGQMCYEGGLYPKNIPITDWREYNVEERHPDVIFTHYPYDDGNYATSLHPDFFSKRLKDFTDLLVYVPYFVVVDDVPEHFCVCAGTLYSDKVFVQSEKVRQTYIRVFREFEKGNNCKGMFGKPEDKFIALGSPKFDAVISARPENFTLPDEYRHILERPDGGRKKVVFYNTTIGAMLACNERYFKKLRAVFSIFRNRDDITLWWRPHPLNEATYRAIRPQLFNEYEEIIADYRRENWGIYDDTAEFHRAIALSDAYYGDVGSTVALYGATGKFILVQSAKHILNNNSFHNITFEAVCDYDGCFWCVDYYFNFFFRIEKTSWKAEFLGYVPNEAFGKNRLYTAIVEYNGKLYFAPGNANEIAVYDVNEGKFSKIQLLPSKAIAETKNSSRLKFCDIIAYEDFLFFVSGSYPAIVKLDPVTNEAEYYSDWLKPLEKLAINPGDIFLWRKAEVVGSRFYIASFNANAVVSFDMKTLKSTVYEVGGKTNAYSDICFDGDHFWLAPNSEGPIVSWSPDTGQYTELWDFPDGFTTKKPSFNSLVYCAGNIWLFPFNANMALKINKEDGNISVADEFQLEYEQSEIFSRRLRPRYFTSFVDDGKIYAYSDKSGLLIELDCRTGSRAERHLVVAKNSMYKVLDCVFQDAYSNNKPYLVEDELLSLNNYLSFLLSDGTNSDGKQIDNKKPKAGDTESTAGKDIFDSCKQFIGFGRDQA